MPRYTEICETPIAVIEQDVGGFYVAMNYACFVCPRKSANNVNQNRNCFIHVELTIVSVDVIEKVLFREGHGDDPTGVPFGFRKDRYHVGFLADFTNIFGKRFSFRGSVFRNELDGNAILRRRLSDMDSTEITGTQLFADAPRFAQQID